MERRTSPLLRMHCCIGDNTRRCTCIPVRIWHSALSLRNQGRRRRLDYLNQAGKICHQGMRNWRSLLVPGTSGHGGKPAKKKRLISIDQKAYKKADFISQECQIVFRCVVKSLRSRRKGLLLQERFLNALITRRNHIVLCVEDLHCVARNARIMASGSLVVSSVVDQTYVEWDVRIMASTKHTAWIVEDQLCVVKNVRTTGDSRARV